MVNRYAGEIHVNPMRILRDDDFNSDGDIKNIEATLKQTLELNKAINNRVQQLLEWLQENNIHGAQFYFADGGYIGIRGLSDKQLLQLSSMRLIELFDYATSKEWVKKYGHQFGLVWEDGRAVDI